jgi:hypothetical protein
VTVQLTLYNFQSMYTSQYNLLFMNILLVTIPPADRLHLLQSADRRRHDGRRSERVGAWLA